MIAVIGRVALFMGVALSLTLTGCASPSQPSRFYRLDSQLSLAAMPEPGVVQASMPMLGVGPVMLASYIDRPQLVERSAGFRVDLHEFDRWAGTLQENIVQVLTTVLQQKLPWSQVIGYPWNGSVRPDYELMLYISRFDRQGDQIKLQARWSLVATKGDRLVRLDRSAIQVPVSGAGIEAGIAASSQALQLLAAEISRQLPPPIADQR
jgi:uncharacterized protein